MYGGYNVSGNEKERFEWRKWDYFWLIGILIVLLYMACSMRLKDNSEIINIISLIASGMSIALAVISIWWGQVNNSSTNEVYGKINEKLNSVQKTTEQLSNNMANKLLEAKTIVTHDENISQNVKKSVSDSIDYVFSKSSSKLDVEDIQMLSIKGLCDDLLINPDAEDFGDKYIRMIKTFYFIRNEKVGNMDLFYEISKKYSEVNELVQNKLNTK